MKALRWARDKIGNLKLIYKMLLSYLILILVPIFVLTTIVFNRCADQLISNVSYSAEQGYEQTRSFLEYKLSKILLASNMIFTNQTVNDIMMRSLENYDLIEQISDMEKLRELLQSFEDKEDVYRVRLYVRDELVYSNDKVNIFPISTAEQTDWYKRVMKNITTRVTFLSNEEIERYEDNALPLLSVARKVTNQQNYRESVGVFRVDFEKNKIIDILQKADPTNDSVTFLLAEDGQVVASSGQIPESWKVTEKNSFLSGLVLGNGSFQEIAVEGQTALAQACRLENTEWRMVTVVPYASLIKQINSLRAGSYALALIVSVVASICAVFVSRSITVRVSRLAKRMKEIREGNTNVGISNNRKDEIGELYNNYNYLIGRINELLQQQYEMGQELKSAELKALQSQINPHFLYNTLDMINWYGYKKEPEHINAVVTALAKFYKQSLNKGSNIVTIEDELKHVFYYMQIQTLRFSGKIQMKMDCEDEIKEYAIPKITLQPIIENAILHGILEKESREGVIFIQGRRIGGRIILKVIDDGVGIDEEVLQELNGEMKKEGKGFGLANIQQRVQLLFGMEFGLHFMSEKGKGTTVELCLPAIPYRELRQNDTGQ